jgi:hypothetical protein
VVKTEVGRENAMETGMVVEGTEAVAKTGEGTEVGTGRAQQ